MKLQFEALDPLFFRDGRPFSMGEESYAEGIFPPLPSTARGALRSLWMAQQLGQPDADPKQLADDSKILELSYFGLGIAGKPIFPAPLDLFFEDKNQAVLPMELMDKKGLVSSSPDDISCLFWANANGKTASVAGHFLDAASMQQYVSGSKKEGLNAIRLADFAHKEHKIGIGRYNDLHLTKEGSLFRLIANRLEDSQGSQLQLLAEVQGFGKFPLAAVVPLGGERRSVAVQAAAFELPATPKLQSKYLKICLLTPGLFDAWYPAHLSKQYPGLTLRAASIGRSIAVGGWDVAKKEPKRMRRAAPAGSVYLYEAADQKQAQEIADQLHGNSIYLSTDDLDGFGLCLIAQPFDNQIIR